MEAWRAAVHWVTKSRTRLSDWTDVHWVSDAIDCLILCPLLLLPSVFPSIRVLSSESAVHTRWLKYWSFSFSNGPSDEYSGLISFRIDWFDLLAVLGTLKSFLQHHNSKASIFWHSAFLMVQLSHPYMTPGKTIISYAYAYISSLLNLPSTTIPLI